MTNTDRLYDVLTIPHDSDGMPLNLAAEREYVTQADLHERVMSPLAPGYRRAIVHTSGPLKAIHVQTYDDSGILYELLVIWRA